MLPPPGKACHFIDRVSDSAGIKGVLLHPTCPFLPPNVETYLPSSLAPANHAHTLEIFPTIQDAHRRIAPLLETPHHPQPSPQLPLLIQHRHLNLYPTRPHPHTLPQVIRKNPYQIVTQQITPCHPRPSTPRILLSPPPPDRAFPHLQTNG